MKKKCLPVLLLLMFFVAPVTDAKRLAVTGNIANIRSGPGTEYEVIWQVEKYHPIKTIRKKDNWYLFRDFENDEGWVHKSLLDEIDTVITKNKICNIRSGPGTKNKVLNTVEKGIPFKVLKRKGDWLHVQHADGDQGWIHNSMVW